MTAREFKTARQTLGFTQEQLAAEIGVSKFAVRRWEQGQVPVARYAIRALERRTLRR